MAGATKSAPMTGSTPRRMRDMLKRPARGAEAGAGIRFLQADVGFSIVIVTNVAESHENIHQVSVRTLRSARGAVGRLGNVPDKPSTSYVHVGRLGNVPDKPSTSYVHVGRLGNVPDKPSTSYVHVGRNL